MKKIYTKGFTLIELLIAIAIVSIITVITFLALDPLKHLLDARTVKRYTDILTLLDAIKVAQVDDGGVYKGELQTILNNGATRMIVTSGTVCAPRTADIDCDVDIALHSCINLTSYTTGARRYLSALPISPKSADALRINWGATIPTIETGYYLQKNTDETITIGSCDGEPESTTSRVNEVKITR